MNCVKVSNDVLEQFCSKMTNCYFHSSRVNKSYSLFLEFGKNSADSLHFKSNFKARWENVSYHNPFEQNCHCFLFNI